MSEDPDDVSMEEEEQPAEVSVALEVDNGAEVTILTPLEEVARLQREVDRLRRVMEGQRRRWRRAKAILLRERNAAQKKAATLDALVKNGVLSKEQVRQATTGRRVCWSPKDVSKALGLRCISRKAYQFATSALRVPLPSISTLSRRTRAFQIAPGVMDAAVAVLEASAQGMTPLERLCVVCFDEMSVNGRYCYDSAADQLMAASKLQVLMVRGLCSKWKQPLYYEFDAAMTPEKLADIIARIESLGLQVVAAVSDMGPGNEAMWKKAGVTDSRSWITHPSDPERKLWVFADAPHLVKLVRTHTVDEKGGLVLPRGDGTTALLSRQCFLELLEVTRRELSPCHKLTHFHVEASGQATQRVYLAAQLFSNSVGKAMEMLLPRRQLQSEAILTVDKWFDTMNSRTRFDPRLERCGYGASPEAAAAQEAALRNMERLIRNTRKATPGHPGGRRSLLPFQRGILRSTASLRGLFADLRESTPELNYIMTSHVNQDCLENVFSQLRGMGGQNQHPDAVETRSRLRILLMAPSPLVAVSSRARAVQLEADEAFLTTETSLENLTNLAFRGLDFQVEDQALVDGATDETDMEQAFVASTAEEQPPSDATSSGSCSSELGIDREALAFVAGYVARKCSAIDPSLGCRTGEATPGAVPDRWLRVVSRGGLTVPSPRWMAVVEGFEVVFCLVMGDTVDKDPGIVRRLCDALAVKEPTLDRRIIRKLARTRMHIRVRWLNSAKADAAEKRRGVKQTHQHSV
ncbi:Transposable element P transposase [Amphibalanus amphitrite]|uniref:Transposable element P transposase n=1 Tax=Amphibalanus amphitrite TaxID=1232801 RepID=A0A6A4V3P1_AMPAM|nr:Transposable element P transposase [Amphibalanus amphitrite]